MPLSEAEAVESAARESGLSINFYARSMLNRERVETAVSISSLRDEVQETRREIAELKELVKRYTEISVQIISKLNSKLNER
jgi:hypothetical protein